MCVCFCLTVCGGRRNKPEAVHIKPAAPRWEEEEKTPSYPKLFGETHQRAHTLKKLARTLTKRWLPFNAEGFSNLKHPARQTSSRKCLCSNLFEILVVFGRIGKA